MKRINKATISTLLLLSMLLTSLASCSEAEQETQKTPDSDPITNDAENESDESTESTESNESDEDADYVLENFGNMSFNGDDFVILTSEAADRATPKFDHEEITGEPVLDAVYTQIVSVEELLDVDISYKQSNDVSRDVQNAATSGDETYKTILQRNTEIAALVTQNLFLDLNQLEYLNFENPWWNQAYKENLTIGGKTYLAFGDLFFEAAIYNVHLMYFNKDLCDENNIEYPYQAVKDGKWTMDYLLTMVEGVSRDLDGDGDMDENDQWGLVHSPIQSSIMFYTAGFHVVSFDEEGYPYLDMYSEEFVNFYEKLYALDYKSNDIWTNSQAQETANFEMFVAGNTLLSSHFLTATPTLRNVDFEVGILPYPKYTEDSEYINWPSGGNFLLGVPSVLNPNDYDFIGVVLEALAAKGYQYVRPALYDVTLQGKLARDPESRDMLDLIFDTMSVDFGWIHTGSSGLGWFVNSCLDSKLANISSFYKRMEKRAENYYNGIVDYYRSID